MATNDDARSVMSHISISHSTADSEGRRSAERGDCINRELSQPNINSNEQKYFLKRQS